MKYLSLFSGIGAFEKALKNIGVNIELVGFSEIDKYAIKSYCAIHRVDESLNLGDITKIRTDEIPEFDLMTWGFPCQDISVAGKMEGIKEGTRSGLYYEGYKILKAKRPKYSIIENVKNLASNRFKSQFESILKDIEELGYTNYWRVLNAKDYGIPQNRERVYIISIRNDILEDKDRKNKIFTFPEPRELNLRLKDMLVDEEYVSEKYYINKPFLLNKTPCKTDSEIKVIGELDIKGHDCIKRVYSINGIAPTLTNMQGGNRQPKILIDEPVIVSNRGNITSGMRIRKLLPRECWRLMGFSDTDFDKAKRAGISDTQLYKQARELNSCKRIRGNI